MSKAFINQKILPWAMLRAGMSEGELADKLTVREEKVMSWVAGSDRPTFAQAQKLAKALGIPFGYLYLNTPPEENLPLTDFRTVGSVSPELDVNTKNFLQDVLYKRDWFKDYRTQQGHDEIGFIGSASLKMEASEVANQIINELGLRPRPKNGNFENYLKFLVSQAEDAGIWVMRTSIVGNNTHRPLKVEVFRGVAISDPLVPLIIINSKDAKSAQIFTMAHELAHLWLGESGISNIDLGDVEFNKSSKVEAFCNNVAAEILTPSDEFLRRWNNQIDFTDQVDLVAGYFKVSRIVVARRALDLGLIGAPEYTNFFRLERAAWEKLALKQKENSGPVSSHIMLPIRYGEKFTGSVLSEAVRGTLLLREASSLLGTKPSKVKTIYSKLRA
jgi:Zn-dependent peptidase ImmA (M78 family)/transcriptional regulator with XRE-family HTH domain